MADTLPEPDAVVELTSEEVQVALSTAARVKAGLPSGPYRFAVEQRCQIIIVGAEGEALFRYRFYRLPDNVTVLEPKRGR